MLTETHMQCNITMLPDYFSFFTFLDFTENIISELYQKAINAGPTITLHVAKAMTIINSISSVLAAESVP